MDDALEMSRLFDKTLDEFGRYDVMFIDNFPTFMIYLKLRMPNAIMVSFLEALSRRKLQAIITCTTRERP